MACVVSDPSLVSATLERAERIGACSVNARLHGVMLRIAESSVQMKRCACVELTVRYSLAR